MPRTADDRREAEPGGVARRLPPALVVVFEVENDEPMVFLDCTNEAEERRLRDWVTSRPHLDDLMQALLDLEADRAAA